MRTALVPAGCAVLAVVTASGAPAASPEARAKPADVVSAPASKQTPREYWTAARMRAAKPVALLPRRGKPLEEAVVRRAGPRTSVPATSPLGGAHFRTAIRTTSGPARAGHYPYPYSRYRWGGPTTDLPARTWGKVFFSTPDGDYVCSATAVTSANESVVWTAGHCAADPGARSFYNHHWVFVPGYDNGRSPFGRFAGKRFFTTQAWYTHGDSSFDLAAVVVGQSRGKTLVDTVGGQGIGFNQTRAQEYVSGGYPADYPFDGKSLYVCDAPLGSNDRASKPPTIAIGCDMTGGSSGGGWLVNVHDGLGTLVSVNSYGYLSRPDAMYGPYQGNAARRLYDQASNWR